jgi:hypothetical protein
MKIELLLLGEEVDGVYLGAVPGLTRESLSVDFMDCVGEGYEVKLVDALLLKEVDLGLTRLLVDLTRPEGKPASLNPCEVLDQCRAVVRGVIKSQVRTANFELPATPAKTEIKRLECI